MFSYPATMRYATKNVVCKTPNELTSRIVKAIAIGKMPETITDAKNRLMFKAI